jgi:transposase-like protein
MAPKPKLSIFEVDVESEPFDRMTPPQIKEIRLREIFSMSKLQMLKLLTHYELLHEFGGQCVECRVQLSVIVVKDRSDGFKFRCSKCKCEKSLRYESVFAGSNLDIRDHFALFYMWAQDYDNRFAINELRLDKSTVCRWYKRFRDVGIEYSYRTGKIGGPGKMVEFDETCLVHQKHHRGQPAPGTQVWYCVGVERDSGGKCFAVRVEKRDAATLDWVIDTYIADGTTLITDEARAHLNFRSRLEQKNLKHFIIRHKKATGGGFARWVLLNDDPQLAASLGVRQCSTGNYWLRVHTNKCEGLNSHLKHKMKRIHGTSRRNVPGYLSEAVLQMNARANKVTPYEQFVDIAQTPILIHDEEEFDLGDGEWEVDEESDDEEIGNTEIEAEVPTADEEAEIEEG